VSTKIIRRERNSTKYQTLTRCSQQNTRYNSSVHLLRLVVQDAVQPIRNRSKVNNEYTTSYTTVKQKVGKKIESLYNKPRTCRHAKQDAVQLGVRLFCFSSIWSAPPEALGGTTYPQSPNFAACTPQGVQLSLRCTFHNGGYKGIMTPKYKAKPKHTHTYVDG